MYYPLVIIITYQCNLNCSYCPILKKNSFIEKKIAFKAIDLYLNLLDNTEGRIKIFGGEPFLKKDLLREIVRYARQRSSEIEIEMTSNGILLEDAILNWLKKYKVNFSISIDGDAESQLKNRKGISLATYRKIIHSIKKWPSSAITNTVIASNIADRFFQNFLYLYNSGIRRFNFLPVAYISWSQKELKLLENQLHLTSFFIRRHPEIYIKNIDINNDLFFFNTGMVVDCSGDIFFSNVVMLKEFQEAKKDLRIGNVKDPNIFKILKRLNNQEEIKKILLSIKKSFHPKILKTNQVLDSLLDNFVKEIELTSGEKNKRVDIKIGYQCNNHCLFCVQGNKREKCAFRTKFEIKKDLINARKTCQSVVFTGGEPTVHPNFLDLVRLAKKLNFQTIQIQSNGRMFAYKTFCQETIKAGANEFSPVLHGHMAKVHDYLTSVPGSFDQVIRGIKNLKILGQTVITNTVITKFNYRHLPEIAKLLVFLGVDQFQFAFVHIVGLAWKNRDFLVPKKSQIMPFVKKGLDIGIKAGKQVMTEAIPYCFMRGYEQYIAEPIIPEAMVIENKFKIEDYKKYRLAQGKTKGPKCKDCLHFSICEGPWREYPKIFGWKEFKPIV
jgi:MoaA/NifB/PqqE/SkfB family radical SAM enzyme